MVSLFPSLSCFIVCFLIMTGLAFAFSNTLFAKVFPCILSSSICWIVCNSIPGTTLGDDQLIIGFTTFDFFRSVPVRSPDASSGSFCLTTSSTVLHGLTEVVLYSGSFQNNLLKNFLTFPILMPLRISQRGKEQFPLDEETGIQPLCEF